MSTMILKIYLRTFLAILMLGADERFVQSKEVYLGCFKDDNERMFDFPNKIHGNSQPSLMTKTYCSNYCQEQYNYVYFGLQFAQECFCGDEYPDISRYPNVSDSDCNTPCVADRSIKCGDTYHMSVYKDCDRVLSLELCAEVECESKTNVWCTKCSDKMLYKLNTTSGMCEDKCSAKNRWCWPGICADDFASGCNCMEGFIKNSTTCQPSKAPDIDSCLVRAMGVNNSGEEWSNLKSKSCHLQKDFYGKFQVEYFRIDLHAYFKVVIKKNINDHRPDFVDREIFGVTDVSVIVRKINITGVTVEERAHPILVDSHPQDPFVENFNISNEEMLSDGERLCLVLMVYGGGYLVPNNYFADVTNTDLKPLENVPYDKTEQTKEVCYIYDNTKPKHCFEIENTTCNSEPLKLSTRFTDSSEIDVNVDGWEDPLPYNDSSVGSGIIEYEISIYEVQHSNDVLVRDNTAQGITYKLKSNETSVRILLPGKLFPMLYAVLLEVRDHASNVRPARRFVLFDNSSAIQTNTDNPIRVTNTTFQWQTNHGPLCFSWEQHFYNYHYKMHYNPLLPIKSDKDIKDDYDQSKGPLSVNGTLNNDGITRFDYSLTKNKTLVLEGRIYNVSLESTNLTVSMSDGDTFEFQLEASDIMNHTLNDSVKVYIDRSVPEITDGWLVKDGYEEIYVHHTDDLSKMALKFKAFDIHSGIREVKWVFGVYENHTNMKLIKEVEAIGVEKMNYSGYCRQNSTSDCYCPKIGNCSLKTFQANLTKINARIGNHNRRYFFTIEAMNSARLTTTHNVSILVDISPPEAGVVFEGPHVSGMSGDIDYTRSNNIFIHWHGFVDHESGIKFYRIALATECLQNIDSLKPGKYNSSQIIETVQTFTKLSFPDAEGQYYTTVIAYNNAINPSRIACSDGIVLDKSTPTVTNLTLRHAQISESFGCFDGEAWLIKHDVSKTKLESFECIDVCKNRSNDEILAVISESINTSHSSFQCKTFPRYNNNTIYIPSDLLSLSWNISEEWSQIAHAVIGFGTLISDSYAPDIQDYTQIPSLDSYIQRHPGLIGETQFYAFIKVMNKAGLETAISFGPILADETPPICKSELKPFIEDNNLVIKWTNQTFKDTEQREEIGKIMFRIGVDDRFVTPFLDWMIIIHGRDCSGYRCIKYPVDKLQKYDTVEGSSFYVQLHVYNYAGHFCTVDTDVIRLPSLFPPSAGVVIDIHPGSDDPYSDVDVTFNSSYFCYAWRGFDHHQNLSLQVGLGTQQENDAVLAFHAIKDVEQQRSCEQFKGTIGEKYYVTIVANCSCGITYASSDGFTVLNESDISSSLHVHHGKNFNSECKRKNTQIQTSNNVTELILSEKLEPGTTYSLKARFNFSLSNLNIHVYIKKQFFSDSQNIVTFLPLSEIDKLSLDIKDPTDKTEYELWKCDPEIHIQSSTTKIPVYWTLPTRHESFVTHFESAVCEITKDENNCKNDILFRNIGKHLETVFRGNFAEGIYKSAVRPCFGLKCLKPVWSKYIEIRSIKGEHPNIQSSGIVTDTCINVNLSMDKFVCSVRIDDEFALGYRWAVFSDYSGQQMLSNWTVVMDTNNKRTIQVSECLHLPVYYHKHLYVCVQSFCLSGAVKYCTPISIESDPNNFNKFILYDLNLNNPSSQDVEHFKYSANIGTDLVYLHDIEMDFAEPDVKVGGLLIGQLDADITWFLMRRTDVPESQCNVNRSCVLEKKTKSGFINFENAQLEDGLYYICAKIQNTDWNVCSDGFLIENSFPGKGTVAIDSYDGFVSDGSEFTVQWSGFKGNPKAVDLGYPSDVAFYQYALGTYPGSDDIVPFTNTDLSEIKTIRQLHLTNGQAYYAAIKGFNHLNKSTEAYSPAVIYDGTPPSIGKVGLKIETMSSFIPAHRFEAEWTDVEDVESGIEKVEIGIGSTNQSTDIIGLTNSEDLLTVQNYNFQDGHRYFIILKATNRAGISSYKSSQAITVDSSPPEVGHVMDVDIQNPANKVDIDYQKDTTISCSWYGFHDTHSHIAYYKVGLGTSPYDDDVVPYTSTGLKTSKTWKGSFYQGLKYYSTVIACNGALLCSTVSSNGIVIDNSAPIPGSVYVGGQGRHSKYLSDVSMLHVSWFGFQDPHSDLDYFEVAGTTLLASDIMEPLNVSLATSLVKGNLNMPINRTMFATVKACNRVQLCSTRSSQGFLVDNTIPNITMVPHIDSIYKTSFGSRVIISDPSFFKIKWEFRDDESPISRTIVTMSSTRDSHVPVDDILLTNEKQLSVSLKGADLLRNGDVYIIRVTACNAAALCISAVSDKILIDFTPPTLGGFLEPLAYASNNNNVIFNLKWYGFVDVESNIQSYYISIGKTYSGSELLADYYILPNSSDNINSQETRISLNITETLPDNLFLSIWAKNDAGLMTRQAKVRTDVLNTQLHHGELIIIKHSCEPDYCNNDCTCSVVGKKCKSQSVGQCRELSNASNISVTVSLKTDHISSAVGSSKCLSAEWFYNEQDKDTILRFELSFGINGSNIGEGVFDLNTQNPWSDVERRTNGSHCVSSSLNHNTLYVAYVRTWISYNEYIISASLPVLVDHTPPTVRMKHFVSDVSDSSNHDVDFIVSSALMSADWTDVFLDDESSIEHFTVSLGTSPSLGRSTHFRWTNVTFEPGTKYYATVRAINVLGMQTEMSSDGFLLDEDPPDTGVVYNTRYYRDVTFQSEYETVAFSWHGFDDQHSYIDAYLVSFDINNDSGLQGSFQNNGLQNIFVYGGKLRHNDRITVLIKARDAAGLESPIVKSRALVIDNTPPTTSECNNFVDVIRKNIEAIESKFIWSGVVLSNQTEMLKILLYIGNIKIQFRAYLSLNDMIISIPFSEGSDGSVVLEHNYLTSEEGQNNISVVLYDIEPVTNISIIVSKCTDLKKSVHDNSSITVQQIGENSVSVYVPASDPESGIKSASMGVGKVYDGFQIQRFLPMSSYLYDVISGNFTHGMRLYVKVEVTNHAGLRSIFRANPIKIDHTPPVFEDLHSSVEYKSNIGSTIINVSWTAVDNESNVKWCEFCIGLMQTSCSLVSWTKTASLTSFDVVLSNVSHGSKLYSTVRCINAVELVGYVHFEPIIVSYLPPKIIDSKIYFVTNNIDSPSGQRMKSVTAWWNGFEDVSGIECYKVLVQNGNSVIRNWEDIGNKNYLRLNIPEVGETTQMFQFNVSGINRGQVTSQINGLILLDYTKPKTTGNQIGFIRTSDKVNTINWENVFVPANKIAVYEVSIGSSEGATDILMPTTTDQNSLSVDLFKDVHQLYIVITATTKSGMSQTYKQNKKL